MRILWLVNSPFPEALSQITGRDSQKKGSGGWQIAAAEQLIKEEGVELFVASSSSCVKEVTIIYGSRLCHIVLPKKKKGVANEYRSILEKFHPDIIHIHGTEYLHGFSFIESCGKDRVILSAQGLVSVIARYYTCGLSVMQIVKSLSFYDIIKRQSIFDAKKRFAEKGAKEVKTIKSVSHVIGRTTWDMVHLRDINSGVNYYHCDETLRDAFYEGCWCYDGCIKHRVFLSQASYPVKGLHIAIKAFALVKKHFPDLQVYIAGSDFIHPSSMRERLKLGGYAKLIKKMIDEYHLNTIIHFTGPLDAEQMKSEYLRANVFVCPSTIENSPNSLGEAQILGVPSIASYVGGIPDFIPNSNCGELYRFEEYEMLASSICKLFERSASIDNSEMRRIASMRHNRKNNAQRLIEIYKVVMAE